MAISVGFEVFIEMRCRSGRSKTHRIVNDGGDECISEITSVVEKIWNNIIMELSQDFSISR